MTAEAAQLRRNSVDQEVPGHELAALQAKYGAVAAKHEEALGKLAALQAAKEAAEAVKTSALSEAATHQQNARSHAIRYAHTISSVRRKHPIYVAVAALILADEVPQNSLTAADASGWLVPERLYASEQPSLSVSISPR